MSKTLQDLAKQALELTDTSELTKTLRESSLNVPETASFAQMAAELAESVKANSWAAMQEDLLRAVQRSDITSLSLADSLSKLESNSFASAAAELSATHADNFARMVQQVPDWLSLSKSFEDHQTFTRAAFGPVEDLLQRTDSALGLASTPFESLLSIPKLIEERFRLPDLGESAFLASSWAKSLRSIDTFNSHYLTDIQSAIERMKSPWLEVHKELQSVQAFAAVQDIGAQLRDSIAAFDENFTAVLRDRLGDWRDSISLPPNIEEIVARSSFYAERGLDATLTNFPPAAFRTSLRIAGLDELAPAVAVVRDYHVPAESGDEEDGFRRTNAAHDRLLRFETHLRRFIDKRMSAAFGAEWAKQRVPGDTYAQWQEKQRRASESGEVSRPIIAYADFTDYERILLRKDNWDAVFKATFRRPESVRESLQRLYPVRVCTMHARLISQDDELLLFVEVRRLQKAMGSF